MTGLNHNLTRIYNTIIRPQLHAYGSELTESDVNELISSMSDSVRIAREVFDFNESDKQLVIDYSAKEFGLVEAEHIYVRGGGFYQDNQETVLNKEAWTYYHKHRDFISDHVFNLEPQVVESIDFETDQIIKKIPNPTLAENSIFLNKGLVIGYVQSGKTANFAHLISKAASIGYKFIIVLGGMTNTLRSQTQFRLDRELTGANHYGSDKPFVSWAPHEQKYRCFTGAPNPVENYDGDFHIPVANFSDHFSASNDVTLAIIKKLAIRDETFRSVLGRLIRWVENRNNMEGPMPPLLVIDDEADQASIDDSTPDEAQPTTINHAVRHLLSLFPQASYIGYTATPFANVFIDSDAEYNGLPDLYPENFIYSLPEPEKYFGTSKFFGTRRVTGETQELIYIENVPDDERRIINNPDEEITDSLKQSFLDFVFSVLIRNHRGIDKNCGFMIHTDHRNFFHDATNLKVRNLLNQSLERIEARDKGFQDFLKTSWNRYRNKSIEISNIQGYSYSYPQFDDASLFHEINEVLTKTKIRIVNGLYDNLDYNSEDLDILICIGGNLMSRGVTIEGLTISYYLRDSPKYDTLLQMGRWFGYREGYEDLVRVYTTERIEEHFEYVMGVEDDLRAEVNRYQEERLTPREFAPRVRAHLRMLPSGKMGAATRINSYSMRAVQTIYMFRNVNILMENNLAVNKLIRDVYVNEEKKSGNYNIDKINIDYLIRFIAEFQTSSPEIAGFNMDDILRYLNVRINANEISEFDLIIAGRNSQLEGSQPEELPHNLIIYPVKRNSRRGSGWRYVENELVNIGVISDSNDIPATDEVIERPLLIIYSIDRINSDSFHNVEYIDNRYIANNEVIEGLDFNPKGFALVFPRSEIRGSEFDYFQQIFLS
jgi:hypothetical protein